MPKSTPAPTAPGSHLGPGPGERYRATPKSTADPRKIIHSGPATMRSRHDPSTKPVSSTVAVQSSLRGPGGHTFGMPDTPGLGMQGPLHAEEGGSPSKASRSAPPARNAGAAAYRG